MGDLFFFGATYFKWLNKIYTLSDRSCLFPIEWNEAFVFVYLLTLLCAGILSLTRSLCSFSGTKYGQGTYFARDASYSLRYARAGDGGRRYMYLARVLVGQYCVGNHTLIVPPAKNPSRPEILFESVVDKQVDPSIFGVFYDNQCYPEYLITMQ